MTDKQEKTAPSNLNAGMYRDSLISAWEHMREARHQLEQAAEGLMRAVPTGSHMHPDDKLLHWSLHRSISPLREEIAVVTRNLNNIWPGWRSDAFGILGASLMMRVKWQEEKDRERRERLTGKGAN